VYFTLDDSDILGYDTVSLGEWLVTFRKNQVSSSSVLVTFQKWELLIIEDEGNSFSRNVLKSHVTQRLIAEDLNSHK
jgi:hypothetical protein